MNYVAWPVQRLPRRLSSGPGRESLRGVLLPRLLAVCASGLALADEVVAITADSGRLLAGLPEPAPGGAAAVPVHPESSVPVPCGKQSIREGLITKADYPHRIVARGDDRGW
jgi:hypothetical protein